MATVTKTLSSLNDATEWVSISGTGVAHVYFSGTGTVVLQAAEDEDGTDAITITGGSFTASDRKEFEGNRGYFRLKCTAYTSGEFVCTLHD